MPQNPGRRPAAQLLAAGGTLALLASFGTPASAQQRDTLSRRDSTHILGTVTVTATRTEKDVFRVPAPVTVVDSSEIRQAAPNTAADLFRNLPGLDVTGVGTNQTRPTIRGQRGQRILLLEDGLRLGNSRRQQDFGELPAIVDVNGVDRVEIVRGPASVLYGTDAIGGVVNLISDGLPRGRDGIGGSLGFRYGSATEQRRPSGELFGRSGRFGFRARAAFRETDSYLAPSGRFGDVRLSDETLVHDSGVHDENESLLLGWNLTSRQQLTAKAEHYHAIDAGFGYVADSVLGGDGTFIQLQYPTQTVDRYSVGYRATGLGAMFADQVDVRGYLLSNERVFDLNVFIPFGPGTPPGAGVQVNSSNFTDLQTLGMRAEATKLIGRHLLTYGIDAFRDRSENTDSSAQTVIGFGPPQTETSTRPQVPNARFRSAGLFAQGDFTVTDRLSLILGARYQSVLAETRATPGLDSDPVSSHDHAVVGAANLLFAITPDLNFVAAVGRGFRSPNLVERFFDGPTPEGTGYQVQNTGLAPETNVNVDVGLKFRRGPIWLEGFLFRNTIRDGIRIEATGDSVGPFPSYRNVNVDKLRFTGGEVYGELSLSRGFALGGSWSKITSKDVNDPENPVGDTYASKLTGQLRYRSPTGRVWGSYVVRHNGEQKEVLAGSSPVGDVLPAFTVHSVGAGARLFTARGVTNSLSVGVENLTNELYAEFSNAGFFRPEPKRSLTLAWTLGF